MNFHGKILHSIEGHNVFYSSYIFATSLTNLIKITFSHLSSNTLQIHSYVKGYNKSTRFQPNTEANVDIFHPSS